MSTPQITTRRATLDDFAALKAFDEALIAYDANFDETLNAKWPESEEATEYFRDRASGAEGVAFMAEVDGKTVGFLTAVMREAHSYRTISQVAELESMFVDPAWRGRAIGEQLVEHFLAWARSSGATRVCVEASYDNSGAVKFYQKMGFIPYNILLEQTISPMRS
ncbi:GNAT family N-acetyltransferase [Chrysiogenes arsenatis]|uniref:GNAT family N-acetyltransferase n=1 Tax=Chrysiogenes arsenatis TaxID=309797 RepID=UPI0004056414|nr:GNAT family N-acetyltransferase [Chrysiogenes arsenatis]